MLEAPLGSGQAPPTPAQIEAEGADFMALMSAPVPGKATG